MSKDTREYINKRDYFSYVPLSETELAYIYNNGYVTDSEGNKVPMSLERMWKLTWKSKVMKKWRKDDPVNAKRLFEARARWIKDNKTS